MRFIRYLTSPRGSWMLLPIIIGVAIPAFVLLHIAISTIAYGRVGNPDGLASALLSCLRFLPLLAVLLLPIFRGLKTWRSIRSPGVCPKCNYDLRESRRRCPECGWALVTPKLKQ